MPLEPADPPSGTPGPLQRAGVCVGIDLGEVRIGVAASDRDRRLATARAVITRSGSEADDHGGIAAIVDELDALLVVVGLPLSLSGAEGPAATRVLAEIERLRGRLSVPVVAVDERFSSVEATQLRRAPARAADAARRGGRGGRSAPGRGGKRGTRRLVVDDAAAAIILQRFLDSSGVLP